MNILIISTQNPFRTSGIVARNLYHVLKDENTNVKVLIKEYNQFESKDFISVETSFDVYREKWKNKFSRLFARWGFTGKLEKTNIDYHVQDYDQTLQYYKTKTVLKKINFKPDVIFYLFQQNFLTAKNLYELNKYTGAKIIWYMMDTAPMTGACHYSWNCKGFIVGCGNCPALFSQKEKDQSSKNLAFKIRYLDQTNLEIVAATEFQYKQAKASYIFKNKPIHKILLSIDPDIFSVASQEQAKTKWEIQADRKVIFCGGTSINDKRKGIKYLIEALEILSVNSEIQDKNVMLLVAGNSDSLFKSLPYEVRYVGFLSNDEQLASVYQASDIFVCPSIEDAGPMMINQSIMTGTPVVSFEMGVASDLVITGLTGYKAKLKDSVDLANGLKTILNLDKNEYVQMKDNCRKLALELYHPLVVKKKFNQIFNGLTQISDATV